MILNDGTTTVTIPDANEDLVSVIDSSRTRTAGGNIRSTVGGERFVLNVSVRTTHTLFRSFIDVMKGNAADYFYTPEDTTKWGTLYPDITFPAAVNVVYDGNAHNDNDVIYFSFTVEVIGYA